MPCGQMGQCAGTEGKADQIDRQVLAHNAPQPLGQRQSYRRVFVRFGRQRGLAVAGQIARWKEALSQ